MIFKPKSLICADETIVLSGEISATAHSCINKDVLKEFWYNFTFQCSTLKLSECEELVFKIGNAEKCPSTVMNTASTSHQTVFAYPLKARLHWSEVI